MARKPKPGAMRVAVEYGKTVAAMTDDGGMSRVFERQGFFWAERVGVGMAEGSDVRQQVDGVDVSDDVTRLRTWAGHPVTSENYFRINGTIYSVVSATPSNDDRMVEYWAVSGLRDLVG